MISHFFALTNRHPCDGSLSAPVIYYLACNLANTDTSSRKQCGVILLFPERRADKVPGGDKFELARHPARGGSSERARLRGMNDPFRDVLTDFSPVSIAVGWIILRDTFICAANQDVGLEESFVPSFLAPPSKVEGSMVMLV